VVTPITPVSNPISYFGKIIADRKDFEFAGWWNHRNPDAPIPDERAEGESSIDDQILVMRRVWGLRKWESRARRHDFPHGARPLEWVRPTLPLLIATYL